MATAPTNNQIAGLLEHIADLLEAQDENPFRIRAYRQGAQTIRDYEKSIADLIRQGKFDEIRELPNIGGGLAAVIGEYVSDERSSLLDDLEAKVSPADVFERVPGIGAELAQRIVDQLDVHSLEELEEAAHDGRLAEVEGFGKRRIAAVEQSLAGMLSRSARRQQRERRKDTQPDRPSVMLLLELDADYRQRAEADKLPKIAPRRFNPSNEAWLPILRTERDGWTFTVLYSNTARAHDLDKTRDWVVIYYERDDRERQNTVVTETQGDLKGKRVVRGRERETREFYEARKV